MQQILQKNILKIWPGISTAIDSANAAWGESHIGDVV